MMKYIRPVLLSLALASANCSSGGSDHDDASTADLCGLAEKDDDDNFLLRAAAEHNYSFSSTLDIDVVPVQPSSELFFDWSEATQDLLGDSVDPLQDIDLVTLVLWSLSEEQLEEKLNSDSLEQSDTVTFATFQTENVSTAASSFDFTSVIGDPIDRDLLLSHFDPATYDPATHVYTLMVEEGQQLGQGTRMIAGFRLDAASSNTQVAVDANSTSLDYTVDLQHSTPTRIPSGVPHIALDWSELTENALGGEFVPLNIDEVLVARYAEDPAELEGEKFLHLRSIAQDMWTGTVEVGNSLALSSLTNASGEPFPGIDATMPRERGSWR